ncbi:LOW QUALITY PROTEIN: hypothetical protein BFAG_01698, partial [Bacteroides fragilis 3_1_12]
GKRVCNTNSTDHSRAVDRTYPYARPHVMGYRRVCSHHLQRPLPALRIKVNGLLHTGYVIIALNGSDYYEVYLLKGKDAECVNEEVCYNELGDVIDRAIECGTDKEEYEKIAISNSPNY